MNRALVAAVLLGFAACTHTPPMPRSPQSITDPTAPPPAPEQRDPHSFANPDEAVVRHLALDLTADFAAHTLSGTARLDIEARPGARELRLDTNALVVSSVRSLPEGEDAVWHWGREDALLGREIVVELVPATRTIEIAYTTSPDATALQWLPAEQTASGRQPFLFSQSQAIRARSWVPCQDTPAVRMTYEATLRVPVGLLALMSAENPTELAADGVYRFRMPQPIPSYLLALAVGELEFRAFDARSGVYAEPPVIAAAAWEFAETPMMIAAAEGLYGPYRWGRYDLLVLPPSFPFGGMENPRLTFATPTVIAGDRSLVDLIAHELAHSWSGNLVTNATWKDFWLNEGFTTYFEHRIMEAVEGREHDDVAAKLDLNRLVKRLADLGPDNPEGRLRRDVSGKNPDSAVDEIAYQKGYFFLRAIEEAVGRSRFDAYLRRYFDAHAFQSVDTDIFLADLRKELIRGDGGLESRLHIATWIDSSEVPPNLPQVTSARLQGVDRAVAAFTDGGPAADLPVQAWKTAEWLHFLRSLPQPLPAERLADLDKAHGLSNRGNSEVLHAWLLHVADAVWEPGFPPLEAFLMRVGRMKYVNSLYRRLAKTPHGLELAHAIYAKARTRYHPVTRAAVDRILAPATAPAQ